MSRFEYKVHFSKNDNILGEYFSKNRQLEFPFMKDIKPEYKSSFTRGYNSFAGIDIKVDFGKGVFQSYEFFKKQLKLPGV